MKRWFIKLSIKRKFIYLYVSFVVLPFCTLATYFFIISSNYLKANIYYGSQSSFDQTSQLISYYMNNINYSMNSFLGNDKLKTIIETDNKNTDLINQVADMQYIRSLFATHRSIPGLINIHIYANNNSFYVGNDSIFQNILIYQNQNWYRYAEKKDPKIAIIPSHYLSDDSMIAFAKPLHSSTDYRIVIGMIRFDINKAEISQMLGQAQQENEVFSYIINTDGELITQTFDSTTYVPYELLEDYADGSMHKFLLNNSMFLTYVSSVNNTDWYVVNVIPYSKIQSSMMSKNIIYLIMFSLFASLGFLFAFLFFKIFLNRLSVMKMHMSNIETELPLLINVTDSKDEIEDLIRTYNYMLSRVDELMKERFHLGNQLKESELKALYEQINPHFLYNTLAMINWLSEEGQTKDVTDVISALSNFYKLSLNKGNSVVTLREELQIIESYIFINKMRFGTDISIQCEFKDDYEDFMIPKLTLQPIVENALIHGILKKQNKAGLIVISVKSINKNLVIQITDNGVGVDQETLKKLNDGTLHTNGNHYGIQNIMTRLNLFYDKTCSIHCENNTTEGMQVSLIIPL